MLLTEKKMNNGHCELKLIALITVHMFLMTQGSFCCYCYCFLDNLKERSCYENDVKFLYGGRKSGILGIK